MLGEQRRWAVRTSGDPILSSSKPPVKQISVSTLICDAGGQVSTRLRKKTRWKPSCWARWVWVYPCWG